jgi:hypothetical protein
MHLKLLIDGVVRQTTVFIAQLSTASGVRSPLAHVADQVFLELAKEIESQGVRRQVVADMFGLALRSYTKKMNRLTESASVRERTLWEAVLAFIGEQNTTRARVVERFAADGEREVAAVLHDLKRSGLVYVTGTGKESVYGLTSAEVRGVVQRTGDVDSVANVVWLELFRRGEATREALQQTFEVSQQVLDDALKDLADTGRVREEAGVLRANNFVVPFGAEQGWESAVLDHFRTVTTAIANKVRQGTTNARPGEEVGGSTFTFTVYPGHPHEAKVRELLSRVRREAQTLWEDVVQYNEERTPDLSCSTRVSFYVGQTLEQEEVDEDGA